MSWQIIYNNTVGAIAQQMQTLNRLQEEVATGTRVNRASDDPIAAFQVLTLNSSNQAASTYINNVGNVSTDMDQCSSSLQSIDDALVRCKQLLTQAASQTYSPSNVQAVGEEIDSLLEQAVSDANTKSMGRYIFGGTDSSTQPYAIQRDTGGRIVSVTYVGSDHPSKVTVAPGVQESGVMVGDKVFRCDSRGEPVFLGNTGAKAGTGTSSVRGDVWLTVIHDQTQYAGATGVAAGASSANGDTIAGDGHALHIDADAHTVRLDDGAAVAYSVASGNLQLKNANGDVVYVDMTGLDAGLTGTTDVAIHATAKLSIDDGVSTTNATLGPQAVTDSRTGGILYVDTSSLTRTGSEPIRVPGTYNLFDMLMNVRDILLQKRPVSQSAWTQTVNQSIKSLDEVYSGVVNHSTAIGARQQAMDTLKSSLTNIQNATQDRTSTLQDADITQLTIELAKVQNFYQLTLSSAAKVMNLSLLDYLGTSTT
jgi:flagellar hook-associated protein 3 FlgL